MKKTISYNKVVPRAGEVYHYKADPCSLDYRPSYEMHDEILLI